MTKKTKQIVVLGALVAALAIGAGAAIAGGGLGFGNDQQSFLNDAAKRLNVTPAELEAALRGAYSDRIDAAVAAGKLTKEQADALKKRSAQGALPLFGGPRHGGPGHGGPGRGGPGLHGQASLAAAATYLGLTPAELRTQLESGKSLAEIAKAQGKSVDGLKKTLSADLQRKLDAAVKDGKLTQAQADEIESRLTEHLDDLVNGTGRPHGDGDHGGWGGPSPPAAGTPQAGAFVPVPTVA